MTKMHNMQSTCLVYEQEDVVKQLYFLFLFLFAYLYAIGLIGRHAANEFIFVSAQSHTPEVKSDQIIPVRCCAWLVFKSHQGNRWKKSLKDGYLNSQELSACLAIQPLSKAMFLHSGHSWCNRRLDFFYSVFWCPICTIQCHEGARVSRCIVRANQVTGFNRRGHVLLPLLLVSCSELSSRAALLVCCVASRNAAKH